MLTILIRVIGISGLTLLVSFFISPKLCPVDHPAWYRATGFFTVSIYLFNCLFFLGIKIVLIMLCKHHFLSEAILRVPLLPNIFDMMTDFVIMVTVLPFYRVILFFHDDFVYAWEIVADMSTCIIDGLRASARVRLPQLRDFLDTVITFLYLSALMLSWVIFVTGYTVLAIHVRSFRAVIAATPTVGQVWHLSKTFAIETVSRGKQLWQRISAAIVSGTVWMMNTTVVRCFWTTMVLTAQIGLVAFVFMMNQLVILLRLLWEEAQVGDQMSSSTTTIAPRSTAPPAQRPAVIPQPYLTGEGVYNLSMSFSELRRLHNSQTAASTRQAASSAPSRPVYRLSGGSSTSTSGTTMGTPRQWPVQVPICSHSTTMGRDGNTVHQEEEGGRPTVPPGAAVKIWSPSEDETSKYRRAVSSDALDRTGIFHCASYTVGRVCHGMVCVGSDDRIFIAADKRRARSTPSKTRAGSGVQYFSCPRTLRRERV